MRVSTLPELPDVLPGTAVTERQPTWRTRVLACARWVAVAIGYVAVVVLLTWPQALHLGDRVAPHHDVLFSMWRVGWVAHQLPRDPSHLLDGNIFHPETGTLTYSDAMLLPGLTGSVLQWLGVSPVAGYNLLLLGAMVVSALAACVVAKRLTGSMPGAFVAGLVFGFAPYRFEHFMHLELQWAMWMPLALGAAVAAGRGRLPAGVAMGVALAAQAYSCLYYAVFLGLVLVVTGVILIAAAPGVRLRAASAFAIGALVAIVLVWPYARAYRTHHEGFGTRARSEIASYSATWASYVTTPPMNALYGWTGERRGRAEANLFPGLTATALAAAGAAPPFTAVRVVLVAGLVLSVDGSLGTNGFIWPRLMGLGEPFANLRAPSRFAICGLLALGLLGSFGVARLSSRMSPRGRAVFATAACLLVLAEYANRPLGLGAPIQRSAVDVWLATQPPTVVAEWPMPRAGALPGHDPEYSFRSTFHWQRLVNGYSGYYPPGYIRLVERMRRFPEDVAIRALRERGVRLVVLHSAHTTPDTYERVTHALSERPDVETVAVFGAGREEIRIVRLRPPG